MWSWVMRIVLTVAVEVGPAGEELVQVGNETGPSGDILRSRINQHCGARELKQHALSLSDVGEMGGHRRRRLRPQRPRGAQNQKERERNSRQRKLLLIAGLGLRDATAFQQEIVSYPERRSQ
jgi:hypothetical protein